MSGYGAHFLNTRKVYKRGSRVDVNVPFQEVRLEDQEEAFVRMYDTSGPWTDPSSILDSSAGLPPLRQAWIDARGDTQVCDGRRRGRSGCAVTQMHYARQGIITPEFVRQQVAQGRAIIPANINHPESEPMIIGRDFCVKINANIGSSALASGVEKEVEKIR